MAEKKAKDTATASKKMPAKKSPAASVKTATASKPKSPVKAKAAPAKASATSKPVAKKTAPVKAPAKQAVKAAPVSKATPAPKKAAPKKQQVKRPTTSGKPMPSRAPGADTKLLTESQLRRGSKKDYMNEEQLQFFYNLLKQQKEETFEHVEMVRQELINSVRETDLIDRAALEDDRALKLRIVDREIKLLRKIDEALMRIRDGSYGFCDVTGEPIGIERLLLRPTATMSIEAKEIAEDKEKHFADEERS